LSYNLTVYTYLAPSKVCDGVGVFSLVDIPKDTVIFEPKKCVQICEWQISSEIREYLEKMTYYDGNGYWIDDDLQRLGQQYYINHSHEPNVAYERSTGKLYAVRDILKDEELTDYYFPGERNWLT
jgi:SET domain-containing protein